MRALTAISFASLALISAHSRDASACGGGFSSETDSQASQTFAVESQKIALAISNERTVLWSQIRYAGTPTDWAWVLPVGQGAVLELADDAWFEALDAATSTQIRGATITCETPGGPSGGSGHSGCGCGSADAAGDGAEPNGAPRGDAQTQGDEDAQVIHAETVGPYETVTLSAASGESAKTWLEANGYVVPREMVPILDGYATAGLDFLAMRLKPGAGVQQMQPVRVVAPGGSPIVPLRMMTAGAPVRTPLTLFVLGEGRYAADNFPAASIEIGKLAWDWASETSNYDELRAAALGAGDGRGLLTTYSRQGLHLAFDGFDDQPASFSTERGTFDNLVDLYFAQAAVNDAKGTACFDVDQNLYATGSVSAECPADGCADDEVDAAEFECDGHSDLATALVGMRPSEVWVTRLEAELPREALADDLVLAPGVQSAVASWLTPASTDNIPANCYEGDGYMAAAAPAKHPRRMPNAGLFALVTALGLTLARRSRRRDD